MLSKISNIIGKNIQQIIAKTDVNKTKIKATKPTIIIEILEINPTTRIIIFTTKDSKIASGSSPFL